MQDYVTPLPFSALALAHGAVAAALVAVLATPRPAYPGWRVVGPGAMHWFALLGCWAMAALIGWVWLFVGSARADAAFQMRVALILSIAFAAAGAWCGVQMALMRRKALRWRGGQIVWRQGGREVTQAFSAFASIRQGFDGSFVIAFQDGQVLKFDIGARNTSDFLVRFSEELGHDVY